MADIPSNDKNNTQDLDESIDFMMSQRKQQVSHNIAPQRTPAHRANQTSQANPSRTSQSGRTPGASSQSQSRPADQARRVSSAQSASRSAQSTPQPGHRINAPTAGEGVNRPAAAQRPNPVKITEEPDNDATRVTKIDKKIPSAVKPDKKNKDKSSTDNNLGGSLVVGMIRALVYLVFVSVIAVILSIFIINVGNDVFAFVKSDEVIEVTIPEGATNDDIADILYENGVIKYKSIFKLYGKLKKKSEDYVAGEYSVTPMMNYQTLYSEFKEKAVSGTSWITVPEGYTVDEIIDLMVSYGIGTKENYVDVINNYDFDYWFIDELNESGWDENRFYRLEGYLFPDTYEFYNASSEVTVINKFLSRFDDVYTSSYKERAAELNMTTDEIVILASMIEKEAGQASDFRNVSSVFYNRLNNSASFPRMESDATVVYAIQHDTGERPNEVTGETIKYDSPYNTYTHEGLPPGAICNPGMNALKYALYPAETSYYYFVSSSDGTTLFARTNAEHESNKASLKSN